MKSIPKPKHCGQNWLDMTPVAGGRICGQCSKTIVDFSRMPWAEIEKIQQENNNAVCGMYSAKQLDHWGRQVPSNNCSRITTTTMLLASMAVSSPSLSQTTSSADTIQRTIIHGTVTGKSFTGSIDTLAFAVISLNESITGTMADEHGNYRIDLTNYIDTIKNPTLVFSMIGYTRLEVQLGNKAGDINYDAQLNQAEMSVTTFYVTEPTLGQRIKNKLYKWFRL